MKRPKEIKEGAEGFAFAAIFNQIMASVYYHVSWYALNPLTGKYKYSHTVCGHRGPGGNLGMKGREAYAKASQINREKGVLLFGGI